jgi:hypothetical protein
MLASLAHTPAPGAPPVRPPRVRRRARRLLTGLAVVPLVAATVAGLAPTASQAATARPTLTFANSGTQSTLGAAYTKALANLLDANTVTYDPNTYNKSGLMTTNPQTFIKAGHEYPQPWTRDGSVNPWNAGSLLEPKVAANTMWSVVDKSGPNGGLRLVQDNQWWDQVIWLTAAWNHYLVTGDQTFLSNAYQTATNTLAARQSNFNSTYGLFQGPAFFNDGISGYPAPPADSSESHGGFVGDYSATSTMMTLSTNSLYYSAYRSAALMAQALGKSPGEVSGLNTRADTLKTKINQYFWIPSKGMYGFFVHNGDGMNGQLDQTEEGTGLSFAIMFGIASSSQAASIMQNTHVQPYGIADTYPNYARYSDAKPGRHNVSIWPVVQGYWADAAASSGNQARFATEVATLAGLANTNNGFFEVYNAKSGVPDGGWQTGGHWGPVTDQTWSATAYLRMIQTDLFGLKFTTEGITFAPTLPSGWGDATLSGIQYRGATLNISLHGAGNVISSFKLDGTTSSANSVSKSLTGTHTVDITLTGAGSANTDGVLKGAESGRCVDVPAASQTNGTVVALWDCNNAANQHWAATATRQLSVYGTKCLDAAGHGTADGTPVEIWDCNGGGNQQWTVGTDGTVVGAESGKCLDATAHGTANNTKLELWTCNGGTNQKWAR